MWEEKKRGGQGEGRRGEVDRVVRVGEGRG